MNEIEIATHCMGRQIIRIDTAERKCLDTQRQERILDLPREQARLAEIGQDAFPRELQTPEALGEWHRAEIAKLWPVIKSAAIKAE